MFFDDWKRLCPNVNVQNVDPHRVLQYSRGRGKKKGRNDKLLINQLHFDVKD